MESQRQKKIAGLIQRDLAEILQNTVTNSGQPGIIVSVTKVYVTADLSIAKAYLSVFPNDKAKPLLEEIQKGLSAFRHAVAQRTRHQIRRMPELMFFIDDSLEYIDAISKSLKGDDNPIKNPDLLSKRKKK